MRSQPIRPPQRAGDEELIPVPIQEPPGPKPRPPLEMPEDAPTPPMQEPPDLPGTLPPSPPPGTEVEPIGDPVRIASRV